MKNLLISIMLLGTSVVCAQKTVHLAPEGHDSWSGSKNRPFKTLERAFAESVNTSGDTLYIQVASGEYRLDKTIKLSDCVKSPVVVCGDEKNKPRFMGGIRIKGWEKYKGNVYRAYIPEVKLYDFSFEQFYVNGKRAIWARTPNKDWYFVKGHKEYAYVSGIRSANYATQRLELEQRDMESLKGLSSEELSDVRFRFYHKWDITQKPLSYACPDSGYIYIPSNPQPIGFSGILLAKRQNSFYCTYFLHNRNVADTKSPYPIKRLEVIRWFNQKSMVFNQSLS